MTNRESYVGKTAYRGEIAANYDRDRVNEPIWRQEQAWIENWSKRIEPGARVLDIPSGTGRFVGIFHARKAQIYAADISEDMLLELRRRWHGHGESLVVSCVDAEALPYANGTFDFVVCWRLFHLLPSATTERVLRELARVCRGEIVVEVLNVAPRGKLRAMIGAGAQWLRGWVCRGRTVKAKDNSTPWAHIANYPQTETGLRTLFSRCGLRLINSETLATEEGIPPRVYRLVHGGKQ